MTESEKMDLEVQRIKKRMLEINDKIENYNKTNEMLDNLEKNVGELEKRRMGTYEKISINIRSFIVSKHVQIRKVVNYNTGKIR